MAYLVAWQVCLFTCLPEGTSVCSPPSHLLVRVPPPTPCFCQLRCGPQAWSQLSSKCLCEPQPTRSFCPADVSDSSTQTLFSVSLSFSPTSLLYPPSLSVFQMFCGSPTDSCSHRNIANPRSFSWALQGASPGRWCLCVPSSAWALVAEILSFSFEPAQ